MLRQFLIALLVATGCFMASTASAAFMWQCIATNDGHTPARWYFDAPSLFQAKLGALDACVQSGMTRHPTSCRIIGCRGNNLYPTAWIPGHYASVWQRDFQ
jgi:hypothetical protein